ncbi:MAG: hypothetical protein DRI32_09745 [Chloroflexi bacterium]|nr:MAG: hypothetical protein DRI32_09745 [Chloroflexota bacterium]
MRTTEYIKNNIDRLPNGYVFTCNDFMDQVESREALVKALNRLAASGRIVKLAKGRYYKPEPSPFGELPPSQYQTVKDLLESQGKIFGYLTGLSMYNSLGLTTQVGNIIQIGRNEIRSSFKRGKYTISFVKQKNRITKENIPLLQLLDGLRFIKKIPDSSIGSSCRILQNRIENLSEKEQRAMVRLAMKYPPVTRALLGAILCDLGQDEITGKLKESLNPLTSYIIPGVSKAVSSAPEWSIK